MTVADEHAQSVGMHEPTKPPISEEPKPSSEWRPAPGAPPPPAERINLNQGWPLHEAVDALPANPMRGSWYTAVVRGMEIECYDVIDALGLGFYPATVVKYLWRHGRKSDNLLEDAKKARCTLDRYIEVLEEKARAATK